MSASGASALPPLGNATRRLASRRARRWKLRDRSITDILTSGERLTELVCEDVYLMDNKAQRVRANLLANSLTARIRRNLPDGIIDNDTLQKIKRDSLKDFQHLENLERQFSSELSRESSRLDKETFQLLKRQKQLQKQSEVSRRKQDRLESSLRSRSGLSSASLLPALGETSRTMEQGGYPEFATVDKDDQSHVKVFKLKGVFVPTNKYSSRIEPLDISIKEKPTTNKDSTHIQDSLRMADITSPVDLPSKSRMSKKGLSVSWSRQSRYYPEDSRADDMSRANTQLSFADTTISVSPERELVYRSPAKEMTKTNQNRTFNSRLSMRSDTFLIQNSKTLKGRRKVETIGLKWRIPPGQQQPTIPEAHSPTRVNVRLQNSGLSHNLMPVTTAMEIAGRSQRQTCWRVQRPPAPSTSEMYKAWIEKLEKLKRCEQRDLYGIPSRATVM
ncbi:uncharacterized protein LOC128207702 [Mya arenaria]|uniref:uncharacterized protein LOC128207702 n=1 Tax=Mya arenaria TaxID=6604 RepID=UPI0022E08200|nr:uncharacterized protein LOC128207702 [Mya arenaria]XP_052766745.1 uncharacterized protein LOC128207702 [Mya arenaria]